MKQYNDIYEFVEGKEVEYQQPINLDGWEWSMKDHIKTSFFYKFGRLLNGNDEDTPVKNIIRPILNLAYRAEDIDVKEIVLYVDDPDNYHLSFLVKKYHDDVFVVQNDLDTYFDELKESKIDFGGGLTKKVEGAKPEVIPLQSIAFCDQTDILSGPIAFKHYFSPDQLKDMEENGWGSESNGATVTVDDLIDMSESKKDPDPTQPENETPGQYIEVYEVHGTLPNEFLDDSDNTPEEAHEKYTYQIQIIGFYKDQNGKKQGVTLYKKKQKKGNLKVVLRDKIYSRALGYGGAEELFEDQVWTSYAVMREKRLLDAASTVLLKTTDPTLAAKHPSGLKNMDNLEVLEIMENTDISQIDTTPRSMALFEKATDKWQEHAQQTGAATDSLLGESPTSGTPFALQNLITREGKGLHEYRRGKYAKDIEAIYKDWIIPEIIKEITNGATFLSELSASEMKFVSDALIEKKTHEFIVEKVLNGETFTEEDKEAFRELTRADFSKGGSKKFVKILKGEFNKTPLRVKINVAGKQKDLAKMTDKLVNIFRQIISNPQGFFQMMQVPEMANTFNEILEYSGLSPVDYAGIKSPIQPQALPEPSTPQLETNQQ